MRNSQIIELEYIYNFKKQKYYSNCTINEVKSLRRVRLFATACTVAYHTPPCMGFSSQEYWSGLLFPSPIVL